MEQTISNKQILRYLTGVCFMLCALAFLINNIINNNFSIVVFLNIAGLILFSLSLFMSYPYLPALGSCLCLISSVISWMPRILDFIYILPNIDIYLSAKPLLFSFLSWLVPFIAFYWLCILIASLNHKYAKPFYITARLLLVCRFIVIAMAHSKFNVFGYIYIIFILASFLLAFSYEKASAANSKFKIEPKEMPRNTAEQLTKLENLKNLLDSGIITAEEFESKKKQILNL